MTQRRFPYWRVLGIVTAVALLAFGTWRMTPSTSTGTQSGSVEKVGLTSFPEKDRPRLPAMRGVGLNGEVLDVAEAAGHVVVINLWGSWCAPCRAEAPDLANVANTTKPLGVSFYGIDTRDDPAAARAFVRRFEIPYPSFDDRDGRVIGQFTGIVPVSAVPSTLVVTPDQRISARVVGRVDARTLRALIDDARAGQGTPSPTPTASTNDRE